MQVDAPNLGQHMRFRDATGADTLRADCVLDADAATPMHLHKHQHERFEITAGRLDVWIDGTRRTCGPGETATFAPGQPHRFRNVSGAPVEVTVAIWPALRTRALFETLFALDRAGRLNRQGAPGPLRLGLLVREYGDEIFLLARVPVGFQLALGRALGAVAKAAGTDLV